MRRIAFTDSEREKMEENNIGVDLQLSHTKITGRD